MAVLLFLSVLIYLAQPHCTIHGAGASPVIVASDQATGTLYTVAPDKIDQLIEEKRVFPEWVKCDNSLPDFGPPDAPCICSKDRRFNPNSNTPFGIEYSVVDGEPVDICFFVLAPDSAQREHLELLARIAQVCAHPSFTKGVREGNSPGDILQFVKLCATRIP